MRPTATGTGSKALSSKPNFGISASKKEGGTFAKPSFAMMGGSKKAAGPDLIIPKANISGLGGGPARVTSNHREDDGDLDDNEPPQIQKASSRP